MKLFWLIITKFYKVLAYPFAPIKVGDFNNHHTIKLQLPLLGFCFWGTWHEKLSVYTLQLIQSSNVSSGKTKKKKSPGPMNVSAVKTTSKAQKFAHIKNRSSPFTSFSSVTPPSARSSSAFFFLFFFYFFSLFSTGWLIVWCLSNLRFLLYFWLHNN